MSSFLVRLSLPAEYVHTSKIGIFSKPNPTLFNPISESQKGESRSKEQGMSIRAIEKPASSSSSSLYPYSSSSSSSQADEGENETQLPVFCLKTKDADMKDLEDKYDCFILDFADPLDSFQGFTRLSLSSSPLGALGSPDEELYLIAERGQVACRDYPHSRHLCVKYPFDKTPHESYCKMCHCYVCDTIAPCSYWKDKHLAHCHASEHTGDWKERRKNTRENQVDQPPSPSSGLWTS